MVIKMPEMIQGKQWEEFIARGRKESEASLPATTGC